MRAKTIVVILVALFAASTPSLFGQQTYVPRFDAYVGYAFLDSPHVSLFENGVAAQIGVRPKTWYSLGFDYSYTTGDLTLTPDLLLPSLQQALGAQLAPYFAAGYKLVVPVHSKTQTFAAGPQLAYRHMQHVTLFLRPVFLGGIHELATPQPLASDAIATGVVRQLAPSGQKTDTTWFIGFGGGFDILFSKHVALRTQADLVHDHLFSDLLTDPRWTVRFSIGPAFNFGKNIAK